MRHFLNKCDYGAGRVVILIPAIYVIEISVNVTLNLNHNKRVWETKLLLCRMKAVGFELYLQPEDDIP